MDCDPHSSGDAEFSGNRIEDEPNYLLSTSKTLEVCQFPENWRITVRLYSLVDAKNVYQSIVKHRFPAAFIDPSMFTGNFLDLQIAALKAITKQKRNAMITKSLPMEFLYALSPRTGISDALKLFGFKPSCSSVLVIWIHNGSAPEPDQLKLFDGIMDQRGQLLDLNEVQELSNYDLLADVYEFPRELPYRNCTNTDWRILLREYITSKIAVKE